MAVDLRHDCPSGGERGEFRLEWTHHSTSRAIVQTDSDLRRPPGNYSGTRNQLMVSRYTNAMEMTVDCWLTDAARFLQDKIDPCPELCELRIKSPACNVSGFREGQRKSKTAPYRNVAGMRCEPTDQCGVTGTSFEFDIPCDLLTL